MEHGPLDAGLTPRKEHLVSEHPGTKGGFYSCESTWTTGYVFLPVHRITERMKEDTRDIMDPCKVMKVVAVSRPVGLWTGSGGRCQSKISVKGTGRLENRDGWVERKGKDELNRIESN